ncbi:MAG TPA: DUF1549 domain-containing protein, partial [Gemmataceae bacterium]
MLERSLLSPAALAGLLACLLLPAAARAESPAADPAGAEFFEKKIRPLLAENCHTCHGPAKQRGGLRLDRKAFLTRGGDSGPPVTPGEPDRSLLIDAVRYEGAIRMPPKGKLTDGQIADLVAWVKRGAPWPDDGVVAAVPQPGEAFDLKARARHWSFRPIRPAAVPAVRDRSWPLQPLDRFILAKVEANGLRPAADCDRRTWLRRVTFDLTGLPPTPEEIHAFLADDSPGAYEKVVERLLASPAYGERWGRHWLDLVRFAETSGHEFDGDMPDAYRYRDYVIRALNADVPYDRFVIEHVAGDLLPSPPRPSPARGEGVVWMRRDPVEGWNESVIATGFWSLGESVHSPVDVRGDEADRIDNQIDVFSKAFLGLTVSCARCHDHKFDAVSQRDYYALCGYLQSSRFQRAFIDDPKPTDELLREMTAVRAKAEAWARQRALDRLAAVANEVRPPAIDPALALPPEQARRRWEGQARARAEWDARARVFEDFGRPGYEGWFVTGHAFGDGPTAGPEAVLSADPARPVARLLLPGVAHSGRAAHRLQGVLRSRTFPIEKNFILYRVAGKGTQVRLIIDGYQQIRDPIYGGLEFAVNHGDEFRWHAQDVAMWKGHRAYVELLDNGDGYLAADAIVFADTPSPPPERPNALLRGLLDDSAADFTDSLRTLVRGLLGEWRAGKWSDA